MRAPTPAPPPPRPSPSPRAPVLAPASSPSCPRPPSPSFLSGLSQAVPMLCRISARETQRSEPAAGRGQTPPLAGPAVHPQAPNAPGAQSGGARAGAQGPGRPAGRASGSSAVHPSTCGSQGERAAPLPGVRAPQPRGWGALGTPPRPPQGRAPPTATPRAVCPPVGKPWQTGRGRRHLAARGTCRHGLGPAAHSAFTFNRLSVSVRAR